MGSDLHMSPPTPDETRLVSCGEVTAVYTRHTDGIYGDTRTWTRKYHVKDPDGVVLTSLKAMSPGVEITTLDPSHTSRSGMPETLSYEVLAAPDRDWDKEIAQAEHAIRRAQEKLQLASEEQVAAHQTLAQLLAEKRQAES